MSGYYDNDIVIVYQVLMLVTSIIKNSNSVTAIRNTSILVVLKLILTI